ncbi:alpha/beta fold hydrolase [Kineococcus sp. SYSU DK006]|uniref:alpha/beta fold hydrolase n=1 Tax=Kineococcus sp. SYSU DK006 TaxID=3383127 RepID=UPI003D7E8A5D
MNPEPPTPGTDPGTDLGSRAQGLAARKAARYARRPVLAAALAAPLAALGAGTSAAAAPAAPPATAPGRGKPTIVLVHGAFADASGWGAVIQRLQRRGCTTIAPANPLRGLASDADYLRTFLSSLTGPIVLVGHSYGGAVITNAATGNPNVKALVYAAAYGLDQGESVDAANHLGGGSSDVVANLVLRPFPGSGTQNADAYVDPAQFRRIFAGDLPEKQVAVMAATQRPGVLSSLVEPSGVPAWKSIPSSYVVATRDGLIPVPAQFAMAERMKAKVTKVRSSHVVMMSHPDEVTAVICDAAGR